MDYKKDAVTVSFLCYSQISSTKSLVNLRKETNFLSRAGEVGFEPTHAASRALCLTAWLLPKKCVISHADPEIPILSLILDDFVIGTDSGRHTILIG